MVVAFTITKINYLKVGLFCDLMRPLFVFTFVVLSSLAALFALFSAYRQKRLWLPQRNSLCFSRSPSCQVIFKQNISSKLSFTNCYGFIVIFLNLGSYYI